MLYAETELALELHTLEANHRTLHGDTAWGPSYISKLEEMIEEEELLARKSRRLALDKLNPPYLLRRIHGHRRYIACLLQEIDLVGKAMEDSDEPNVTDPSYYIQDAVNRGTAIIVGAPYVSLPLSSLRNMRTEFLPQPR